MANIKLFEVNKNVAVNLEDISAIKKYISWEYGITEPSYMLDIYLNSGSIINTELGQLEIDSIFNKLKGELAER